ncbi:MAG TPA: hypothetical protein PL070_13365 [Flavobacteriales bacterium]|nr:hypothetical protein [Flavobacteriales bacterium]
MELDPIKLESISKIIQILFYLTAATVAVLTYLSAKKGLLNTVNTEYHKRAFDKIETLSQELLSEFDSTSEHWWAKDDSTRKFLDEIHEIFKKNKVEILKNKEFHSGVPSPKSFIRLTGIVRRIKSDPFVPKEIRDNVVLHLENRANKMLEIQIHEIRKYLDELANGKHGDDYSLNAAIVHNRINDNLYKSNCGISQVEEQVHQIRFFIQSYLEKFNPLK